MLVCLLSVVIPCGRRPSTPPGIPIIHNRIPLSSPRRREIPGFLAEAVPFALPVFGCFGVPLVSAATPHLAQRFRSIIEAVPFVNTLLGNWLTNFQIGRLNLVFSLINPLVVAYTSLDTLSYPFLTPTFKLIAFPFCLSSGRVAARSRLADLPLWPGVTNKRKRLGPD